MNDVIYALITYENGVLVCMEASWVLPENSPTIIDDQVQVIGTKGAAYIDACDKGLRFTSEAKGSSYPDTRHWPYINASPGGALFSELLAFTSAIMNNSAAHLCSAMDAYIALEVVDAIEKSITTGKEVEIT